MISISWVITTLLLIIYREPCPLLFKAGTRPSEWRLAKRCNTNGCARSSSSDRGSRLEVARRPPVTLTSGTRRPWTWALTVGKVVTSMTHILSLLFFVLLCSKLNIIFSALNIIIVHRVAFEIFNLHATKNVNAIKNDDYVLLLTSIGKRSLIYYTKCCDNQ